MEVASAAAGADVECGGGGDRRKPPHAATEHGTRKGDITDDPAAAQNIIKSLNLGNYHPTPYFTTFAGGNMKSMKTKTDLEKIFSSFEGKRILIIGDVMVDAYVLGQVDRISPEAPVPVVSVHKRYSRLGGAANVALNIKALGAQALLCSVIGDDLRGKEFVSLLEKRGLSDEGLVKSKDRITTTKFRVIGNKTQMLRVDEEDTKCLSDKDFGALCGFIEEKIRGDEIHAIIFEDYDKGVIDRRLIDFVTTLSKERNIIVTADPKRRNFDGYHDISLFKPNLKELNEGLGISLQSSDIQGVGEASRKLAAKSNIDTVMVTLSENGILASSGDKLYHRPAEVRNIADVSGAGDTVISTVTLALSSGMEIEEALILANLAGGLVCEEVGVVPVEKEKLLQEAKTKLL